MPHGHGSSGLLSSNIAARGESWVPRGLFVAGVLAFGVGMGITAPAPQAEEPPAVAYNSGEGNPGGLNESHRRIVLTPSMAPNEDSDCNNEQATADVIQLNQSIINPVRSAGNATRRLIRRRKSCRMGPHRWRPAFGEQCHAVPVRQQVPMALRLSVATRKFQRLLSNGFVHEPPAWPRFKLRETPKNCPNTLACCT